MADLISVIVPVYNCEKYVRQCIESILSQTYSELELILVDDGSTDHSGEICDSYAKCYKNVRSLHRSNGGITKARLTGAEAARGTWITFVDADDWIKKDFYEMLCRESEGIDLVISGIIRHHQERDVECKTYYKAGVYDKRAIGEKIIPTMLWDPEIETWALDPSLCTKLFKRELLIKELKKAGEVGSDYGEDSMVLFPMIFKIEKLKVVEKAFYYHRQRPKNVFPEYIMDGSFLDKLYTVYQYLKNEFRQTEYWQVMKKQADLFFMDSMEYKRRAYGYIGHEGFVSAFPFDEIKKGSKVVLYGAGRVGETYKKQNEEYRFCQIVSWVDRRNKQLSMRQKHVEGVETILEKDFDYVLIAVDKYNMAKEIGKDLARLGIPREKIIWRSVRKCQADLWD